MSNDDRVFADEAAAAHIQNDLRQQIAAAVLGHADVISADAVAIFPYAGAEALDADYCGRLGHFLTGLLAFAVRDARVDARGGIIADLHRIVLERLLPLDQLFSFVYFTERATLDELALDDHLGATSEPWPLVGQIVRRASFDLLGAYSERAQLAPGDSAIVDKLTTLHTRSMMDAVLAKELERAGRYGDVVSLILFDVDRLSTINQEHGYGVGDRILERVGILIRQYFRQHDWVARHSEDSFAVLLTRTDAERVTELAERVRATVEERLGFTDHRNDRPVIVTLSAAVINLRIAIGDVIDPERLIADAEIAVDRAKQQGRNRVQRVDGYSGPLRSDPPHQAPRTKAPGT
jgi:diguanylate cyclase (GGDEF)-like protein